MHFILQAVNCQIRAEKGEGVLSPFLLLLPLSPATTDPGLGLRSNTDV